MTGVEERTVELEDEADFFAATRIAGRDSRPDSVSVNPDDYFDSLGNDRLRDAVRRLLDDVSDVGGEVHWRGSGGYPRIRVRGDKGPKVIPSLSANDYGTWRLGAWQDCRMTQASARLTGYGSLALAWDHTTAPSSGARQTWTRLRASWLSPSTSFGTSPLLRPSGRQRQRVLTGRRTARRAADHVIRKEP